MKTYAPKSLLVVVLAITSFLSYGQNPIIDLVNTPNNDIDGQVVTCANDGSLLPQIFLCGANDTAPLAVNFPGSTIAWQILDENSCTDFGENCTNGSPTCMYSTVGTGSSFPVNADGKYRLRIDNGNGVFENHYFHVYQNDLDLEFQKADIGCEPTGNITITNLGSNYGFQLVNADNDQILVPFSTNNGPSFVITANGNYRVEATQLGLDGNPLTNACIFSTPAISVGTSNFQVQGSATEADCSGVATVTATLTGGTPNYTYELRLNDGLDGGRGTLVQVITGQSTDSYTFTGVGQGEYSVVGINSDGCEQSDIVTVAVDASNTLTFSARVSQHITCREGNILVDPDGGKPPYRYAIWQYIDEQDNLITSYNSPSDIPSSEFQTSEIFDILNPGNYTFVLVDRFGCFTVSNSVDIEFVPPAEFDAPTIIDQACFGEATASIQMNLIDDGGYQLTYYLFDGTISQQDVFDGNFDITNAVATNNSGFFPGLMSGDYTIIINMRKGSADCDYPYYYSVNGPANAMAAEAILIQPYNCIQTGTIRATNYGGGTAPYEFSLDGANWQTDDMFIRLLPGNYTIFVRDDNGCTVETNPIDILPVDTPDDLLFTATAITCDNPDANVSVTVVGGTGTYNFQITSPTSTPATSINGDTAIFENLSPGTYTFQVTDANQCSYTESFTIVAINPIGVVGQVINNISCIGLNDGTVQFNVSGFDATFSYVVNNSGGTTVDAQGASSTSTISINALPTDTYTITVTDDITNCTATADVEITAPTTALSVSLMVTDLGCSSTGTNPGSVSISATGGWGGYEYELTDPSGTPQGPQSANTFGNLTDTSGNYTVAVRDSGGCEITQTFSLTPVVTPVLDVTANSLCYDSTNGLTLTATITSGGEAPFQYRLNGGAYQSSNIFTGLGPGSYTIEVIDSKNCTAVDNIDVFPTLSATANLIKDLDCSASPDAEISINISDGNPSFSYEVLRDGSNIQASAPVPSVPFTYITSVAGTYSFIITDSEGCAITTNEILITPNTPPMVVENPTNPLCNTSADGNVELQISGGTPPYQIEFDGSAPSTQTTYGGLTDGTYTYTVTDAKGCTLTDNVTLIAPPPLVPGTIDVITDFRCDNTSATLQVINYSGGTPGYTFSIDGINFQASDTFTTGITAGTYVITVRDANNCLAQTPAIVIDSLDPPTDLSFAQTTPICPAVVADITVSVTNGNAPFVYEIIAPIAGAINNGNNNIFTGLAPGTYTFQVTDSRGCVLQENYTIADIPRVDVIAQLTSNISCFGSTDGAFTFTVDDFTSTFSYTVENSLSTVIQSQNNSNLTTPIGVSGLAADTYTVTVTDDVTNCTATTSITISGPPAALDFTFTSTAETCIENATITVTATDGWGSYEYQLENTVGPAIVYAYQGSPIFTNVPAGSYTIYVRDSGGCIVDRPITIDPAETPTISLDGTSDLCYDNTDRASLVVSITDGVAPYSYRINGGGLILATGNPFTITDLTPGTYTIEVTDAFGCVSNAVTQTISTQLMANAVLTKALDCTASPDAVIDVTISGGYTPYATYEVSTNGGTSWSPATAIVGNAFSYVTGISGNFDFRITDNQGCTVITRAIVAPIDTPDITSLIQTNDILCNGDNGASIQVNLDTSRGVAPFTISVVNTTTSTNYGTQTSGLPAGTYEVTVTDANSCTDMETITISEPDPIMFTPTLTDIQCDASGTNPTNNTIPGSIAITGVTGGTPEYTYYLTANNGMAPQSYTTTPGNRDYTFTILNFGIYYVEIVDANGCSVNSNEIIASPPDDLDIDVSTVTADCSLGGTAIVTVSSTFSSNDYQFAVLEYYTPPYSNNYQGPDVVNGDTATFTGLTPGVTYTFVVFDNATNCYYFETADAPIDSPSNMTASLNEVSNVSCTGSADGSVSFTIDNYANDASSIDYEIFNFQSNTSVGISGNVTVNPPAVGTGVTVNDIGPLPPGVYYILFTETDGTNQGCSIATEDFTIEEASVPLVANAILVTNDNCGINAGEIMATGQFGRAPYEFQLALSTDPTPTVATWAGSTNNVFNVEGGNYVVYVKDANDCIESDAVLVPIDPSPEISVALNDQCTADEGSFSVDIILDVAGTAPHSISIDGGVPQAASGLTMAGNRITINNLSSGPHSFTIYDQNNCSETEVITIYPPLDILANVTASENCDPVNSGEVTVFASGGSGNYAYSQITPAGPTNATGIFSGLTHSLAYTFEVEDTTTNCTEQVTITLPAPMVPTFSLEPTPVSCFGGSDGSITVNLDTGNIDVPYQYSLDGGTTTQPSNVFTGLSQGTYTVTVISSKGCEDSRSIDVDEPTELDISALASVFSCDDPTSTITVTISNDLFGNPSGTGPYVYSFDNGTNYQPGNTYQVPFGSTNVNIVVRDANGCLDTAVVPVPVRQEVQATISADAPMDCTDNQQIISINASNGSGTYTYNELPSGNTVADPTNIIITQPGTYSYEVIDTVTNCSVTVEHQVAPYDLIEVIASVTTDASCSDSLDGEIEVTLTGYTGTFDYQVFDGGGNAVLGASGSDNATSDPFTFSVGSILPMGMYSVQITETAFPECVGTSNLVTIGAPEPLTLQLLGTVNANCNEANAIVTVQASGGTAPYSYGASISGAGTPATFSFDETIELDPLTSTSWDIYVMDSNNCILNTPLAVVIGTDTTPDITLALVDECADEGSLEITVSLDAVNFGVPPYTMSLDGNAFESITSFPHTYTNLISGPHTVEIRDANGCNELENITIDPTLDIVAQVMAQPSCTANDGVIAFTITGGDGTNTVNLLNAGTLADTGLSPTGNQFIGVAPGSYIVRVTDSPITPTSCFADAPIALEVPTPVTLLQTDRTHVSCAGLSDGTITINMEPSSTGVNDNPPYIFEITNGTTTITQNTNVFIGLTAGIYDITVTSNRNCEATDQVTIMEPVALDAAVTNTTPFACDMNNLQEVAEIEITITAGTGTPDYFYSVNGGAFLPTGGLIFTHEVTSDGNYDIVIRDNNACEYSLPTVVIDPLPVINLTVLDGTPDCATGQEITVTSSGHSTNPSVDLTFELLETGEIRANTNVDSQTFYLTDPGIYTVRVTDNGTGCYENITYTVDPRPTYGVAITAATPISCLGDADGSLVVNFNGYSGTYNYEVFNEDGSTTGIGTSSSAHPLVVNNLPAGNYFVRVSPTVYPYCEEEETLVATIVSPSEALDAIPQELRAAGCSDNLGEISVVPEGGYPPYNIVLTHSGGQQYPANNVNAHVFTGLSSGSYTIQVLDSQNCEWLGSANVATTPNLMATAIGTAPICFSDPNGTIIANATGGSGSYNYFINYYDETGTNIEFTPSIPQSSNEFNNLGEGYYSITITDNLGCSDTTAIIHLDGPDQLLAELTLTTAMTCMDDAIVTLTAMGGTAPYQYFNMENGLWEPFNSGAQHIFTVGEGVQYAQIRDANNCESTSQVPVVINAVPDVVLNIDYASPSVNCADAMTASIYASAIGGIGDYTFDILQNGNLIASITDSRNGVFENLAPGDYTVRATSQGGCNPDEEPVSIANPAPLFFTYEAEHISCSGLEDGAVTLTLSGGGGNYQYAISPNLDQFFNEDPNQGLAAGQYRFENLVAGTYTVIAQDANECFFVEEFEIINPSPVNAVVGTMIPEACYGDANGSFSIEISGGTAPYRAALNSNTPENFTDQGDTITFDNLTQGTYVVFVRDANDCEESIIVELGGGVNLNAEVLPIYECFGNTPTNYLEVTFEDASVANDVMYALDLIDPNDTSRMQLDATFTNLSPGLHTLSIISVSSGCLVSYEFEILDFEPLSLALETNNINEITAVAQGGLPPYTYYFNDRNNGVDNTYYINSTGSYNVRVVDANGCEALAAIEMEFIDIEFPNFFTPDGDGSNDYWIPENIGGFPNIQIKVYDRYGRVVAEVWEGYKGWDGNYDGYPLPTGDYWYVVRLNGENDEREFVGHFTLYR